MRKIIEHSVVPAILAHNEEEFTQKLSKVKNLGAMLHIDVMDGVFVPNTTWAPRERVKELLGDTPFEAHLMVADPEKAAGEWLTAGAQRIIVHAESIPSATALCCAKNMHDQFVLALNPETPIATITPWCADLKTVMLMGVKPGWSGQEFQTHVIQKIRELREKAPHMEISVDGGVTLKNTALIKQSGADTLVAASAILNTEDPEQAFKDLQKS